MKQIHVGLVGFGRIGRVHALVNEAIPMALCSDFAVRTTMVYTAESPPPAYAACRLVASPTDILAAEDIQVVDICTPNDSHYELATGAMQAGKALVVEKPPALTAHQAQTLASLAQEKRLLSHTGLNYRFLPGINALRELVAKGTLGHITGFTVRALHAGYLNPQRPIGWNLKKATSGGGPLLDLGIHLLDAVQFTLGSIAGVAAETGTEVTHRPGPSGPERVDVEDWGRVRVTLAAGATGLVEATRVAPVLEEQTTFEIFGTLGSLRYDIHSPWLLEQHDWQTGTTTRYRCQPQSTFGRHAAALYPGGSLSMGWLIDSQLACLASFYGDVAKGYKRYAEAPDLAVAAQAQELVECCYASAAHGGEYTPCKGEKLYA